MVNKARMQGCDQKGKPQFSTCVVLCPSGRAAEGCLESVMDIRPLTPAYAVSPQIALEDLPAIAAAGFTTVINNRPCMEIPPALQNDAMKAAAEAAGLSFVTLPVTHATLNMETVNAQNDACANATGPVLAYCASGTRCTIVWALGQAGVLDTDTILQTAAENGYDLSQMRHQLDAIASTR